MQFTSAQQATILAWYNANASGQTDNAAIALLNALVSPNYFVWNPTVLKTALKAQVSAANYTPSDAPDTTLLYQNRAMLCELKQSSIVWLTQPSGTFPDTIDCSVAGVRQNLKDAMISIPSGTSGANQDAGWGNATTPGTVRTVMMRPCTVLEKLFVSAGSGAGNAGADARGLNTNPDILGVDATGAPLQGNITEQQMSDIRGGL